MTADPGPDGRHPARRPGISPRAAEELRLSTSTDLAAVTGMVLDAVVPGFADAAVVFAAENLLRGGDPDGARPGGGRDEPGRVAVRRLGIRFADAGVHDPVVFPTGQVVVLAPGSPYARCMSGGEPEVFTQPGAQAVEHVAVAGRAVFSRYASFLAVPLMAGHAVTGFIGLARAVGPGFGDKDVADIVRLASCAGTGIANVAALERHQAIAAALQRGLLATEPSQPEHLEVAGRCLPAAGNLVGGDWYDIIPLPQGRTGLIIGDVMGHGPVAAATMAQLRAAAHALAQLDLEPAELMRQLGRTILTLRGMPMATCVYAVVDPGSASCSLAAAGHLPPVLLFPDGRARILDLPSGQSLGIGLAAYGQARIKLPPGAVLALYTDGLVETRTRSYDQGVSDLLAELARGTGSLGSRCERITDALALHPEDDVTLVLARIPAAGAAPAGRGS